MGIVIVEYFDRAFATRTVEMQMDKKVLERGEDYVRTVAALNLAEQNKRGKGRRGFNKIKRVTVKSNSPTHTT
jgi:hypothetical protein